MTPAPEPTQLAYDAATGQPVDVPISQLPDLVRSGAVGFGAGQTVTVRDATGELRQVGADDAVAHFGQTYLGGAASETDFRRQEYDKSLDTLGGQAGAFAMGLGNAATLGFGKGIASTFGRDAEENARVRAYIEGQDRVNPGTQLAGEVAGMVAPALLSGGASLGARGGAGAVARGAAAVGAPASLVSEGAGIIGRGAARLAERFGATEGGLMARGLEMTAAGAAEGAVYGLGAETSQALQHNEALTAEKLIAAAGHGALLGGGMGGGLALASHGARGLMAGVGKGAEREAVAAERLAAEVTPTVREGGALDKLADRLGLTREKLAEIAAEKAIKATGGNAGQMAKLAEMGEAAQARVAKLIIETVPERLGADLMAATKADMLRAVSAEKKAVGSRLEALTAELDATGVKVDRAAIADRLVSEVWAPLAGDRILSGTERKLEKIIDNLEKGGEMSFRELHQARAKVDKLANKMGDGATKDMFEAARGVLEDELQKQAAKTSAPSAEWAARWSAAKGDYQAAKWAEGALEKSVPKEVGSNRTLGLSEQLGLLGGGGMGAKLGAMVAGPVGAAVGGVAGGLLSAFAQNTVRRFGDQAVASVANAAAKHGTQQAIVNGVDTVIGKATSKLTNVGPKVSALTEAALSGGKAVATAVKAVPVRPVATMQEGKRSAKARAEEYNRTAEALASFVAAKGAPAREMTAGLDDGTARAVEASALKAAKWLQSKVPQAVGGDPLRGGAGGVVPPSEQDKFLRYARAVNDPLSVVEDASNGKLTPEAAEAIRACYPLLAGEIAGQILGKLATKTGPDGLTYNNAIHIGALLGTPTHELLKPQSIATLQATFGEQTGQAGQTMSDRASVPSPAPSAMKPANIASEVESKAQRIAQR